MTNGRIAVPSTKYPRTTNWPIVTTRLPVLAALASLFVATSSFPATDGVVASAAEVDDRVVEPEVVDGIAWYDVEDWGVEGKAWRDTKRYFDRLPGKAEGVVRSPVWSLSRHSAGMCARFRTDATNIRVRYKLTSPSLGMWHMPPSGVSGVDLYAEDADGALRWLGVSRPKGQEVDSVLASDIVPGERTYAAYLPLYNGVEWMKIGVPEKTKFQPLRPRAKPIVFYGTSITHGACASRPGMAYPAILGRWLEHPIVNLGFSGNGRMEEEVGQMIAEIDAAVYVIDCVPNMNAESVGERAEPLVRLLRRERPDIPIVLIEDRAFTNARFRPERQQHHAATAAALRAAYDKLQADGVENVYYVSRDGLLGDDGEAATDGSHPSDLGMMRMAEALNPLLRKLVDEGQ